MIHYLKVWPEYFQPLWIGTKEFEIRQNDRDFQVGDTLLLKEWNPKTGKYTGREFPKRITYIIQGKFGLPNNLCVMQLR
ncbi:MAG: DUF3850 domain-containing protein [Nanoarchaeota archaeon]|nr:DUF3850 domain-containing protein [Nanoarchaeota archaeon]